MNMNMKKLSVISLLVLLVSQLSYSHSIRYGSDMMLSDGVDEEGKPMPFLQLRLSEMCEPIYGILPCSSNIWGLLFLIVVYEILLSYGGKYVAMGSELFFQITGPGIFGASLFQFLGMIPQIALVLVSALSGSAEAAQQGATFGMGLIAGTTIMLLTLVWGVSVILGSYDLSEAVTVDETGIQTRNAPKGYGVVTDAETSYTARLMLVTLVPFLILVLAKAFNSPTGRRVMILVALIVTVLLLLGYVLYQIFQPWVQNRRFEYLMNKYAKDKLLKLLSKNGKPDTNKIHQLFSTIDKDNSSSVSPLELRVLLLGVKMDDDDLSTERDVEDILESFDLSGDGRISQDEFIRGMTSLASDLADQTPDRIKKNVSRDSQKNQLQQGLLSKKTSASRKATNDSWLNYSKAFFFVILGTAMATVLSQPLVTSVNEFAEAANLSSFWVSYLAIPFALNYGVAVQSIASAREKTQKSISLTLSALYGGVYMNNVVGMIVFLAPVFARGLWVEVFAKVGVVLVICVGMTLLTSLRTSFSRLTGYLVLMLYPVSLALVYLITSVLGWA